MCVFFFNYRNGCVTLNANWMCSSSDSRLSFLLSPQQQWEQSAARKAARARISSLSEWYSVCRDISFTQAPSSEWTYCRNRCIMPSPTLQTHPSTTTITLKYKAAADTTYCRYSWQELVIVECNHEIEVTVAKGLRDGGKGNVLTLNCMLHSHIPSEASAWDGCYSTNMDY